MIRQPETMDELLNMRLDDLKFVTKETRAKLRAELDAQEAEHHASLYAGIDADTETETAFLRRMEQSEWDAAPHGDPIRVTSWTPVDMANALDQPPPLPEFLTLDNNTLALLYAARDHVFYGPSESGKTWVALIAAAQALIAGHNVAVIDFEDNAQGVGERLQLLGVDADDLRNLERFRYANPHEPVRPDRAGRYPPAAGDLAELVAWAPPLVVIDGVTEGLSIEGLSEMSATDVATWFGLISRRFRAAGSCVVLVDHTAKSATDGKPTELGSQHKRGGITGASYFVDVIRRPGRAVGSDPVSGLLRLRLAKDRAGAIRGRYPGELPVVADIDLTSWPDGGTTWHVLPAGQSATATVDELAESIVDYLLVSGGRPGEPGESIGAIAQGIGRSRTDTGVGAKLTEMVRAGYVTRERGARGAKLHALTDAGLEHYQSTDGGDE